ncbi:FAD-dependent monooxygenase, partial [Halomonas sp. FL8]
ASGRRRATLPLPEGRAISRRQLDAWLVRQAIQAGVAFLDSTQVVLRPVDSQAGRRRILLRQGQTQRSISARLVIGGDGLGSRLLREEAPGELQVAEGSRIGVGTTFDEAPAFYTAGRIHMACAASGYVGLVRVESDRLNIGAALDPGWIKRCGGPAAAVQGVLRQTGFPCWNALGEADWHGTPQLTRRRTRLGSERVLILGDAAGYVEPFTGEGMGWAVAGAAALEPLALEGISAWRPALVERWNARHARVVRARQRGCHGVAAVLRRPRLLQATLPWLDAVPASVAPLTAWLDRDYPCHRREAQ